MSTIYIVKSLMSSPNFILYSEELSDLTQEITYRFKKETRQRISAVRSKFKKPISNHTLNFHGLYICKDDVREEIESQIKRADYAMKEIDPMLYASVIFIPLDGNAIRQGEMYEQISKAIKGKIYTDLIERLNTLPTLAQLPDRSKRSLQKMISRLEDMNVLDDEEIADQLADIRDKIEAEAFAPLRDELEKQVQTLGKRGAFLEL